MDTVRKVIDTSDKSELISGLVKKALTILKSQNHITLKVAPVHVDLLNDRLTEIAAVYPNVDILEVKGDDNLSSNDLIMESDIGIVDASIEVQMAALKDAFLNCFQNNEKSNHLVT
jgi:type III secretion protein L